MVGIKSQAHSCQTPRIPEALNPRPKCYLRFSQGLVAKYFLGSGSRSVSLTATSILSKLTTHTIYVSCRYGRLSSRLSTIRSTTARPLPNLQRMDCCTAPTVCWIAPPGLAYPPESMISGIHEYQGSLFGGFVDGQKNVGFILGPPATATPYCKSSAHHPTERRFWRIQVGF